MMTTTKHAFPSMQKIEETFSLDNLWDGDVLETLKSYFVGNKFSESSLAHKLVIWFPEEWRAVLHELKKLLYSPAPV
jgi:hypothetical protein